MMYTDDMWQITTQISEQWCLHSSSPCQLYYHPPICHIKFWRQGITQKKEYNIQTTVKVWNQEYYALVLTTMKMPTWVAETCWWLLCNKITFINLSAFVGLFNKCYTNVTILGGHNHTRGAPDSVIWESIITSSSANKNKCQIIQFPRSETNIDWWQKKYYLSWENVNELQKMITETIINVILTHTATCIQDLRPPLAYLQKVSRRWLGAGQASNKGNTGCPFVGTASLGALLKDPLLKQLGNYSTWADCS